MTATDELRAMLDKRGVEWETDRSGFRVMWGKPVDEFHDTMQFKAVDNALPNGGLNVHICGFTPEQAIAATLGAGTCKDVCSGVSEFTCSACGFNCDLTSWISLFDGDDGRHRHHHHGTPHYCPNCGRKVVDE